MTNRSSTREEILKDIEGLKLEIKSGEDGFEQVVMAGEQKVTTPDSILKNLTGAPDFSALRREAEEVLKKQSAKLNLNLASANALKLSHELQVYEIELEMQIEELTKAALVLQESEYLYRALFEKANDGILYLSPNAKILSYNEAFARMHGYSIEEMKNISLKDLDTPETTALVAGRMEELQTLKSLKFEVNQYHKDGHIITLEVSASSFNLGGVEIIQALHRDITGRKQEEEKIIAANLELTKIDSEKNKFFSIIAHDLRGPFLGLLGLTGVLNRESREMAVEDIADFSGVLYKSVVNIYELVENLLEWAQLQKGTTVFSPELHPLQQVLSNELALVQQLAKQKEITLMNNIPETVNIFADARMIKSVFRNIFSNAIKFTEKGGKIAAQATSREDGMIQISISDTGIGIPPNVIDLIFSSGEKTSTRGTNNEPSTGLGLLLCEELVEINGGKIWVENNRDKGSTFYFTIPTRNNN